MKSKPNKIKPSCAKNKTAPGYTRTKSDASQAPAAAMCQSCRCLGIASSSVVHSNTAAAKDSIFTEQPAQPPDVPNATTMGVTSSPNLPSREELMRHCNILLNRLISFRDAWNYHAVGAITLQLRSALLRFATMDEIKTEISRRGGL